MPVYFIQAEQGGLIKIGKSNRPADRLAQIQIQCPVWLRILAVVPGGGPEESALHARFRHLQKHGEWFEPAEDLLRFIAEEGEPSQDVRSPNMLPRKTPAKSVIHCTAEFLGWLLEFARDLDVDLSDLTVRAVAAYAADQGFPESPPVVEFPDRKKRRLQGMDERLPASNTQFPVVASSEWRAWLNRFADDRRTNVSRLVRVALDAYGARHQRPPAHIDRLRRPRFV